MTDPTLQRLSRFYGLPITAEVAAARSESLTDSDADDLFAAHLGRNYGYFGALDKTLSGFVVLSNEGDDAWLLDARDTGAVYFQDHEERTFSARFPTLTDWLGWRRDKARSPDDKGVDARWGISNALVSRRFVPTSQLARRLQWAVWFFAQPMPRDLGTDADGHEARNGIGWFLDQLGPSPRARFEQERDALSADPHLTLSWLLVAAATADEAMLREAVALGPQGVALVDAFARGLSVGPSGNLAALPSFARRRGRLLKHMARRTTGVEALARIEAAVTACPTDDALDKALWLRDIALQTGQPEALARAGAAAGDAPVGTLLRAFDDAQNGRAGSPDALAAMAVVRAPAEPLEARAALLVAVQPVLPAAEALAALEALLADDPYHFGLLERAAQVAASLDDPRAAEFEARRAAVAEIRPVYVSCRPRSSAEDVQKSLEAADALRPEAQALLAQRVLATPGGFHRMLVERALAVSVTLPGPWRAAAWARGVGALGKSGVAALRGALPTLDAAARADVQWVMADEIAAEGPPIVQEMTRRDVREALLKWTLADGDSGAVDAALDQLERGGTAQRRVILATVLNPFDKAYQVARMSDAQALRAAKGLVAIQRAGDGDKGLFHEAGHQLFRMHHKGAEAFLIEALRAEQNPEVAANLYAAVRGCAGDRARDALVARVFEERRAYWRMGDALAAVWTPEVHASLLARIRDTPGEAGERAAAAYVAALVEHIKKFAPVLDVGAAMLASTPSEAPGRRAYVLLEAARIALIERKYPEARGFLDAAEALGAAPYSDYHSVDRRGDWHSPLTTDATLAETVARLRSGELEGNARKAKRSVEKAVKTGKPQLKITDDKLSELAQKKLNRRLFHDRARGTVWMLSEDGGFCYFDGFTVTDAPFRVTLQPDVHVFLQAATGFSERVSLWTESAGSFVDVARFGRHVLFGFGINNGQWTLLGMEFDTADDAAEAIERIKASPLKGYALQEPWYIPRRGGILRILYHPKEDGGYNSDRVWVSAPEPAMERAAEEKFWRVLRDRPGARMVSVEWMESLKRRAEQPVFNALQGLNWNRDIDLATALDQPTVMRDLVQASGFGELVSIASAPPESPEYLARLDVIGDAALRATMTDLYGRIGALRVAVGGAVGEFLPLSLVKGPDSVIARQGGRNVSLEQLGSLAYLGGGVVSFVLAAHVAEAVAALAPEARGRLCGAPPGADVKTVSLEGTAGSATVTWSATLDPSRAYFYTREGRKNGKVAWETALYADAAAAQKAFDEAVARRTRKGMTPPVA